MYGSKDLSAVQFLMEFAQTQLCYDDDLDRVVKESGPMGELFEVIHEGMNAHSTKRMSASAPKYAAERLDAVRA